MPAGNRSAVALTSCPDYDEERVRTAVEESVSMIGGLGGVIREGDRVLLKPNLLAPCAPGEVVTTHPAVVKAVIAVVMEAGGVPFIADTPGFLYGSGSGTRALVKSGLKAVADEARIESFQFESVENGFIETEVPEGVQLKSVFAARLALEADVIITMPKLKTHASTWYTGAVKNMFGAVSRKTRKQAHVLATYEKFSGSIVDIYSVFRPGLAIMDAVVGMEGEGPRHGRARQAGLILASRDPVALDAAASAVIGFDPAEIATTRIASGRGLGGGDLERIDILGESIACAAVDFEKPSGRRINMHPLLMKLGYRFLKTRPECLQDRCDRCAICVRSCPVGAIVMGPYPEIDRDRCIECYCCNEMCPTGAMEISQSWLARRLA